MTPKGDLSKCEGKVVGTCPACKTEGGKGDAAFTYIGSMGDEVQTLHLWNCHQGHTVTGDSIAKATADDFAGAQAAYDGSCDP